MSLVPLGLLNTYLKGIYSWVQTDLGQRGADFFGVERTAAIPVEESARGVVKVIDSSTRESHSGKLFRHNGNEEPW